MICRGEVEVTVEVAVAVKIVIDGVDLHRAGGEKVEGVEVVKAGIAGIEAVKEGAPAAEMSLITRPIHKSTLPDFLDAHERVI